MCRARSRSFSVATARASRSWSSFTILSSCSPAPSPLSEPLHPPVPPRARGWRPGSAPPRTPPASPSPATPRTRAPPAPGQGHGAAPASAAITGPRRCSPPPLLRALPRRAARAALARGADLDEGHEVLGGLHGGVARAEDRDALVLEDRLRLRHVRQLVVPEHARRAGRGGARALPVRWPWRPAQMICRWRSPRSGRSPPSRGAQAQPARGDAGTGAKPATATARRTTARSASRRCGAASTGRSVTPPRILFVGPVAEVR